MRDLLLLAAYVVGWFLTALCLAWPRAGDDPREDGTFAAVVGGLLWPLLLATALALLPLVAMGWLVSRLTSRGVTSEQSEAST